MKLFLALPAISGSFLIIACFLWCSCLPLHAGEAREEIRVALEKEAQPELPLRNLRYFPLKKMKVGLALSGGGARGFAHIGVLKAFEERNIPIDLIVGTSSGSIVGGFYAAGFSAEQIEQIIREVDWSSIFADETYRSQLFFSQKDIPRRHVLQFRLDGFVPTIPSSISQGQKVFQTLYNRLLQANFQAANNFDNLKIPFRAVATDIISGRKIVLDSGDLAEAINASSAFPLLFAPVEIDSLWLVDGGITDNLPVEVAFKEGADIVIAVDATSHLRKKEEINLPWEIADQATTIMMAASTEENRRKADFLLTPDLGEIKGGNFQESDSIIQMGYRSAVCSMDSLIGVIARAEALRRGEYESLGAITALRVEGMSGEILETFRGRFKTAPGKEIYREDLLTDLRMMYNSGYLEDAYAVIREDGEQREAVFRVLQQPHINRVVFRHRGVLQDSIFAPLAAELSGKILNIVILEKRMVELRNQLIRQGHSLAQIRSITYQPETGNLEIEVDEGYIDRIRISGNSVTRDLVILREFPLREGELFRAAQATEGIQNIYSTDLFDRVLINAVKENQENVLIIKVKERKYSIARLGAHVSLERKAEGFVELLNDNFLGTATQASLFGSVGDYIRHAEGLLNAVRLYKTYLTSRLSVYYEEREDRYYQGLVLQGEYMTTVRGGHFVIGQQIKRLGLISAELRVENISVTSGDPAFPYQDKYRLRSFTIRSVVDKRDRIPFPENGIYNRWYWETGNQQILESSKPFTKIFLGLEGYYPIFDKKLNYHPYLYAGSADLTLPFTEFFFFGGQNNFPGLHEREKFGRQFIQAGLDIRYRIRWNLPIEAYLLGNYSIGAAWERADAKIEGSDFLHSLSVSFAINSLLGPLKLSYASLPGKREMVHFSFGFDF